jgi:hypothetical protein
MVHTERAALIDNLKNLDDARWEEQSLCGDWTVHDVVAHLVDTARTTRLGFVVGLARARFDFDRQNARGVERHRGATPQETLERLQARTPASFGGAKELVGRVRLTAADADVSIGDGPQVSGSAISLLLAISGRRVALDDLDGPGVTVLAAAN